jgi:hypothetical protein
MLNSLPIPKPIIVLIMIFLGSWIGYELMLFSQDGNFNYWESLGSPPDKPTEILVANTVFVYVETNNGVYECGQYPNSECWRKLNNEEKIPEPIVNIYPCEASYNVSPPEGNVIDEYQVLMCGGDIYTQVEYVLLDDGDVLMWKLGKSDLGEYGGRILASIFGAIGGLICGIILAIKKHK